MILGQNVVLRIPTSVGNFEFNLPQSKTLDGKTIKTIQVSELTIDPQGSPNTNVPFYLTLKTKDKKDVCTVTRKMLDWGQGQNPPEFNIKNFDPQSSVVRFQAAPGASNLVLIFYYE
jgi:hypothetical protein